MNFFMEAPSCAPRGLLWHRIMTEFGAKSERSKMLRTHCQTSGVSLQEQDPYNNVVRTAFEAMSAVLGGTQSLHTNSFDEAIALPTEFSARIARNTQLILQEETGVTKVVDPLAGSYYVESLTNELPRRPGKLIEEVEEMGGMTKAVEQRPAEAADRGSRRRRQAMIDRGEEVIVGVNKYRKDHEDPIDILDIDNNARCAPRRSRGWRKSASAATRRPAKRRWRAGTAGERGRQPARRRGRGRAGARLVGEISMAMEKVFGRHRAEVKVLAGVYGSPTRATRGFAAIQTGRRGLRRGEGPRPADAGRQDGPGRARPGRQGDRHGLRRYRLRRGCGPPVPDPEEAAQDAIDNDVHVVGISSQAAGHKTLAPKLIEALKAEGAGDIIVICGGVIPHQDYEFLQEAG
jgi:methylmalonyl-CoA mutase